jgi:thymidylate synthase
MVDLMEPQSGPQFPPVNQVELMIEKLAEVPYSRRAQAITWIPHCDPMTDDPPCLQRVWARLLKDEEGWALNLNTHWRSRDLWKAWFMNVFALTDLQRTMAERLADMLGEPVRCARYVDVADSLHIYGSYRDEKMDAEIAKMKASPYTNRAWDSSILQADFDEARAHLRADPDHYAKGKGY